MNLLSLARAAKRESGLTSSAADPAAFASATGDDLRFFHWVIWAWRDLDLMHKTWKWRRAAGQATTSGSMTLAPDAVAPGFAISSFSSWLPASREYQPSTYPVADGVSTERPLTFLPYDVFRKQFILSSHTTNNLQYWTVAPNGDFMVGPTPDEDHVVNADYIKGHTALALDADEPTLPEDYHMLIVWRALQQYGGFDAASEVFQRADMNERSMMSALTQDQLPAPRWMGRPLA